MSACERAHSGHPHPHHQDALECLSAAQLCLQFCLTFNSCTRPPYLLKLIYLLAAVTGRACPLKDPNHQRERERVSFYRTLPLSMVSEGDTESGSFHLEASIDALSSFEAVRCRLCQRVQSSIAYRNWSNHRRHSSALPRVLVTTRGVSIQLSQLHPSPDPLGHFLLIFRENKTAGQRGEP